MVVMVCACVVLSGCYMVPLALVGPATSGFSTASIFQATATTSVNYMVKKSTGKTFTEHAIDAINKNTLRQSYFPKSEINKFIFPSKKPAS